MWQEEFGEKSGEEWREEIPGKRGHGTGACQGSLTAARRRRRLRREALKDCAAWIAVFPGRTHARVLPRWRRLRLPIARPSSLSTIEMGGLSRVVSAAVAGYRPGLVWRGRV